jgi:hypothetical protein
VVVSASSRTAFKVTRRLKVVFGPCIFRGSLAKGAPPPPPLSNTPGGLVPPCLE